jgi:hypothetical protein
VKCIVWNFDGLNFITDKDKAEDLKKLRFENGDIIQNIESYFAIDDFSESDSDDDSGYFIFIKCISFC